MPGKYYSAIEKDETIASGATLRSTMSIANAAQVALHLEWTITSAATTSTSVWTSCKNAPSASSEADWVEETSISLSGPTSSTGKSMAHLNNVNARWLRIKVVSASGTVDSYSLFAHGKG